jgi:chromosome segregation ATPase
VFRELYRKNKLQIMKDEYNQRKQKFKDKSDFVALNSTFKVLKNSLDDVKALINDLEDARSIKAKMHEYKKQMIEKGEFNPIKHKKALLEERESYRKKREMAELKQEEQQEREREVRREIEQLDWEARKLRAKKKGLMKDNKFLSDKLVETKRVIEGQERESTAMEEKDKEEMQNLENLQQRFYQETVKMANLSEDIEKVVEFIKDFTQAVGTAKVKLSEEMVFKTFEELHQDDKDNINEYIANSGVSFD